MGLFIVLEGGDGCGKSTQAQALHNRLLQEGHPSLLLHEPGGTPLGEQVRRLLKAQRGDTPRTQQSEHQADITPLTELLLFSAARAQLTSTVLRPALEEGRVVVCDRYTPSTVAYQGYGRGIPLETIEQVNRLSTVGLEPDLVLLLDMPPEGGLSRTARRGNQEEQQRFEEEPLDFHRRVRNGYLELAKADPERWLVVDGALPQEQVAEAIWQRVQPLLRGRGAES